jgi:hypothetical protein
MQEQYSALCENGNDKTGKGLNVQMKVGHLGSLCKSQTYFRSQTTCDSGKFLRTHVKSSAQTTVKGDESRNGRVRRWLNVQIRFGHLNSLRRPH